MHTSMYQALPWMFSYDLQFIRVLPKLSSFLVRKVGHSSPAPLPVFLIINMLLKNNILDLGSCEILLIYPLAGDDSHIYIWVGGLCFCLDMHVYAPDRVGNEDSHNWDCSFTAHTQYIKLIFWPFTRNFRKDLVNPK